MTETNLVRVYELEFALEFKGIKGLLLRILDLVGGI